MRPAVVGLIFIATIDMIKGSVFNGLTFSIENISYVALITFIVGFVLYIKKVDMIKLISTGAILGVVLSVLFDKII